MAPQPHQCNPQATTLQQLLVRQINYVTARVELLGVRQKHVMADYSGSQRTYYAYPKHQPMPSYWEPDKHHYASYHTSGVALSLVSRQVLYRWSRSMVTNCLVTSGILCPWLQFTLRGFMAGTTTDKALSFKLLLILAHILALWSLLHQLWLLPLAILLAVPL